MAPFYGLYCRRWVPDCKRDSWLSTGSVLGRPRAGSWSWDQSCNGHVTCRRGYFQTLFPTFWLLHSFPPPSTMFLRLMPSNCIADLSTSDGHPVVHCFLHFDRYSGSFLSIVKRSFLGEGWEQNLTVSVRIRIQNTARNCLKKMPAVGFL